MRGAIVLTAVTLGASLYLTGCASTPRQATQNVAPAAETSARNAPAPGPPGSPDLNAYKQTVGRAVEDSWRELIRQNANIQIEQGTSAHVRVTISASGKVSAEILPGGDEELGRLSAHAVRAAKLPPIPEKVLAELKSDTLVIDRFGFNLF